MFDVRRTLRETHAFNPGSVATLIPVSVKAFMSTLKKKEHRFDPQRRWPVRVGMTGAQAGQAHHSEAHL